MYDTRAGEARGAHLKRKVGELSQEIQYLKDLINTLRTASFDEAQDLLRRIQSTAELEEALKLISDSSLLLSVRKRSVTSGSEKEDSQLQSPSPTPEAGKRKRPKEDAPPPRKDPRMSIEQLTSTNPETGYPKKLYTYPPVPYALEAVRRPEMRNYGSVASDETDYEATPITR